MELGRDADTGGQVKYVVELARELGRHKSVARVALLTRHTIDRKVSTDYARPEEPRGEKARIVRVPFGSKRYLAREMRAREGRYSRFTVIRKYPPPMIGRSSVRLDTQSTALTTRLPENEHPRRCRRSETKHEVFLSVRVDAPVSLLPPRTAATYEFGGRSRLTGFARLI